MQPLVSSLYAGDCTVHRLRKTHTYIYIYTQYIYIYIQLRPRSPEDEQGNARNM